MTHDHAEDAALVDAALRTAGLGDIGLIGSRAKWARLRHRLESEGGFGEDDLARVTTPIGLPGLVGKEPATIAVGVAADLLLRWSPDRVPVNEEPRLPLSGPGDEGMPATRHTFGEP